MDRLFTGIHTPSTFGTFLRTFTFGHVRQLDSIAASLLVGLGTQTPLLAGADQVTGFGYSGVGLERPGRDRRHAAIAAGHRGDPAAAGAPPG